MRPAERITAALREARERRGLGLVAYLTAGFPSRERFAADLRAIAAAADVVEIGVPFSDPMADGLTIQRASHRALAAGASLRWILQRLEENEVSAGTPLLLMSYLNPLLAFGLEPLAERAAAAGVCGMIVPDLPLEESEPLRAVLAPHGLALVQMVTPETGGQRLARLAAASEGFLYAVTRTGITGGAVELPGQALEYLGAVRLAARLPVCAGFGIREPAQVAAIRAHVDGVVVGSALVECLERGEDPGRLLAGLRAAALNQPVGG